MDRSSWRAARPRSWRDLADPTDQQRASSIACDGNRGQSSSRSGTETCCRCCTIIATKGFRCLISEHRDGELIARIAESLGFRTVRGSTSRGASRALVGLARELEAGHDVAITPDGPRGPARSFAPGALIAAQRANAPVIAVGCRGRVGVATCAHGIDSRFRDHSAQSRIAYSDPVTLDAGNAARCGRGSATLSGADGGGGAASRVRDLVERVWFGDDVLARVARQRSLQRRCCIARRSAYASSCTTLECSTIARARRCPRSASAT